MLQSILNYVRKSFRDAALAGVPLDPLDAETKLRGRVLALSAASTKTDAGIDLDAPTAKRGKK